MNRLIGFIVVTGLVSASAAPASAAAAGPFSGFYVGVNLGGASGESLFDPISDPNGTVASAKGDDRRLIGGGLFGYDWRSPDGIVLGAEADFNGTGLGQHAVAPAIIGGAPIGPNPQVDYFARLHWTSSIRGRVGFVANRLMIYGTGGVVFGQVRVDTDQTSRDSSIHTGWTAGAGAEWAFTRAWSAGVEYRYSDLGTRDYDTGLFFSDAIPPGPLPTLHVRMGLTVDQLMARLTYHIGAR